MLFLSTQTIYQLVQICSAAILACDALVEAATEVADVALGADQEDGHLQGRTLDDEEREDALLLFGEGVLGRETFVDVGMVLLDDTL